MLSTLFIACTNNKVENTKDEVAVISFINVRKADAIIIQVDDKNYLIDTGTKETFPLLRVAIDVLKIKEFSGVFLTHGDKDHIGGFSDLSKQMKVEHLYIGKIGDIHNTGVKEIAREKEIAITELSFGDESKLSKNLSFWVLAPEVYDESDDNNNSLVIMFNICDKRVLLTGDMCIEETDQLLANDFSLKADILKVPHHGREECNSQKFINKVNPDFAVICTNTIEQSNTAHSDVIKRLGASSIFITEDYKYGISLVIRKNRDIEVIEIIVNEK